MSKPHQYQNFINRRRFLQASGLVGISALAGCGTTDNSEMDPTPSNPLKDNSTTTEEPATVVRDISFRPTNEKATIDFSIRLNEKVDPSEIKIETEVDSVSRSDISEHAVAGNIEAAPGEVNSIVITIDTANGESHSFESYQYARKYEVSAVNSDLQFPPLYMLFWDGGVSKTFEDCAVGMPAVGAYSQMPQHFNRENREAFERHFDQMQGHGINTIWVAAGHNPVEFDILDMYREEVELFDEVDLFFEYPLSAAISNHGRFDEIFDDLERFEEIIRSYDNVGTIDGKPVMALWRFGDIHPSREIYDRFEADYGGLTPFVEKVKNALTIDGTQPYLVLNIGGSAEHWVKASDKPTGDFWKAISKSDAVQNGIASLEPREDGDEKSFFRERNLAHIKATHEFAKQNGLDFIPNVFNGFDTRKNECWEMEGYFGRSPELFKSQLEAALEYRTRDVIHIWSWNEWAEGYMIEPGTYQGENFQGVEYGTTYLEILEQNKRRAD